MTIVKVPTGWRRGLTLVELLIALAIIGVTFGVLAFTQVSTLQVNTASRSASDATDFANAWLEDEVRTVLEGFASVQAACPSGAPCTESISDGRFLGTGTTETLGTGYVEEGIVRVAVVMTSPAAVSFSRLVSCIDVVPPPSVAVPGPCPEPVP